MSTPDNLIFRTSNVLYITAAGRGNRKLLLLDKYGFPRGRISKQKFYFGFRTGDMIKAVIPKGKYKGIWVGSVACRKRGNFDIKVSNGKRYSVSYKYCQIIQKFDGYEYMLNKI